MQNLRNTVNPETRGLRNRNIIVARGINMLPSDLNRLLDRGNTLWKISGFSPEIPVSVFKYRDCTVLEQYLSDNPLTGGTITLMLPRYKQIFKSRYKRLATLKGMERIQGWLSSLSYGRVVDRKREVHDGYANTCRVVNEGG